MMAIKEGHPPHEEGKDKTTLARAIVLDYAKAESNAICRLDLTKTLPDLWQIQIQGDGPKVAEVKHTIETLPTLGDSAPSDPESVAEAQLKRWSELLEVLRSKGFRVESLPESDHRLNLTVDMTSGRSLSSVDALHEFATPGETFASELSAAIAKAFTEPAAALARQINEAVLQKDLASAVAAVKDAKEKGIFAFPLSSELLQAMCAIEVSEMTPEDRRSLLEIRAAVASQLKSWKVTGDDAEALLSEFKQSMTSEQITNFRLAAATSALDRGHKESGLLVIRELLSAEGEMSATKRGWCWRNVSLVLAPDDADARNAARQSADAFLQAGDKKEAARSLVRLSDCVAFGKPEDAIDTLDEMFALAAKEGLDDRDLGSAAKHIRAIRLSELGRHSEALNDALAAVELRRGIGGLETQLANSLYLASIESKRLGREEESEKWEAEADALVQSNPDPQHRLAIEATALFTSFDKAKADDLSKRAKAAGAIEILAAVNVAISEHDPTLDEPARVAILERTLDDLDAAGAHDRAKEPARLALALRLEHLGQLARAEDWFRTILADNPINFSVGARLVQCLWDQNKWESAANFLHSEVERFGKQPSRLFALGKSLVEAGRFSEALSPLTDSINLAEGPELKNLGREMRDRALDAGATLLPPAPAPNQANPITYEELEIALAAFSKFIAADKRMSFWINENNDHKWASHPERRGKDFLHIFLKGWFQDRIDVFDEISAGAGRIDLYVKFGNGLAAVLELKMCGKGYTSTYAASGEEQICHYLKNRDTSRGYLVVFDARMNDFGKPLLKSKAVKTFTLAEFFIDLRPKVKQKGVKSDD